MTDDTYTHQRQMVERPSPAGSHPGDAEINLFSSAAIIEYFWMKAWRLVWTK